MSEIADLATQIAQVIVYTMVLALFALGAYIVYEGTNEWRARRRLEKAIGRLEAEKITKAYYENSP